MNGHPSRPASEASSRPTHVSAQPVWHEGRQFGRHEVQVEIGGGPLMRVYRAYDPLTRRQVAIKTLRLGPEQTASDQVRSQRLLQEAQAVGRLGHPNVVQIFDHGEAYFVMELLEGEILATRLHRAGPLAAEEAVPLLAALAAALDHCHTRGVLHRDVRPGNVMVLRDGTPKLLGFGLSQMLGERETAGDRALGMPAYMAPERIGGAAATPATDVYSLGVMAYEALTGHRPFEGENVGSVAYRAVYEAPPPPRRWRPALPGIFDEVFAWVLAKDPGQRPGTAAAFVGALESAEAAFAGRRSVPRTARRALDEETFDLSALLAEELRREVSAGESSATAPGPALEVVTVPPSATVYVDGLHLGQTPLVLHGLESGAHGLRLVRKGYTAVQATLDLQQGVARLEFTLQPRASRRRGGRAGAPHALADLLLSNSPDPPAWGTAAPQLTARLRRPPES